MLQDKLASMVAARDDLAAAELSTQRIIARAFACHISCSIPRKPRIRPRSRRSRHAQAWT